MKILFIALFCGFVFGLGLIISGMSNPARVLNFLDWSEQWDPTLAMVMGGAIAIALPGFYWVKHRCQQPWFGNSFDIPKRNNIDAKLVVGSGLFGVGWGIAGLCPGPAIVGAATLNTDILLFVGAMIIGMLVQHWLFTSKLAPDG